ncbi:precorrin-3B C(17)-methyltransferase [Geofilum rhodophaeum]|uniref:precorrin-3B C(17)-methyltransferase n=1 Tax=Geofilum rhodophaeum TaxID=1965019 RepID=UPI000B520CF5|nr:precorrin-3B C(17)-methyltransferase [Geofilum rhodophaeum]
MKAPKIYIIGIGPGHEKYLTTEALAALNHCEVIIGYKRYLQLINQTIEGKTLISSGMMQERERAESAFERAESGLATAVVSSGDAGVYGMAPLLLEMKKERRSVVELEIIPGISSLFAAAALFGAPLGHDFCVLSLSDLLTPWTTIENRIEAAAKGDFVTAVYNPASKERYWQLLRLKEVFLKCRKAETPVGIARQVGRSDQELRIVQLKDLKAEDADMLSILIIGNSQTESIDKQLLTPRGYATKYNNMPKKKGKVGRRIMKESFSLIRKQLQGADHMDAETLWASLYAIHTTADFSLAPLIEVQANSIRQLHAWLTQNASTHIVCDSEMAAAGIRKGVLAPHNIHLHCYISHPEVIEKAENKNITRAQAALHKAAEIHPDALYVFGNAPTGLRELIKLSRKGLMKPSGIIAAPVGFVNVLESKLELKHGLPATNKIIIKGNRGGSNLAATLVNAILSWDQAEAFNPGEGM